MKGASYGTTLGATVAAMFPDKIDKMVLDGVLNSHEYYHAYETEWISGTDLSWSGFFQGCVAAPESCVLAKNGKSAEQLEGEFFDFLYKLKYEPIPNPTLGTVVGYTELKSVALVALYSPGIWPTIALVLENIYTGNLTLFNKVYAQASTPDDASATPEAIYGIKCSEKTTPAHNFADYEPYIQKTYDFSELLGDAYTSWDMICSQWKMRAKEVYEGDFNVKTKNPILFVSNTFDPLTPITSGRNMSSGFEGSVLLEQHGYGVRLQSSHMMRWLTSKLARTSRASFSLYNWMGAKVLLRRKSTGSRYSLRARHSLVFKQNLCRRSGDPRLYDVDR